VVLDRPEAQGGELRFAYTFELKRIGGQWKLTNGVLPGAQTRD
jgi:hypothetical protein